MRRSRLKTILLYFASQFSVYTKFGVDPSKNTSNCSSLLHDCHWVIHRKNQQSPIPACKYRGLFSVHFTIFLRSAHRSVLCHRMSALIFPPSQQRLYALRPGFDFALRRFKMVAAVGIELHLHLAHGVRAGAEGFHDLYNMSGPAAVCHERHDRVAVRPRIINYQKLFHALTSCTHFSSAACAPSTLLP